LTPLGEDWQKCASSVRFVAFGNPTPIVPKSSRKVLGVAALFAAAFTINAVAQQASVSVDATSTVRVVDERVFGMNTPFWDSTFPSATSLDSLTQMGTRFMRFGGGSATDAYDWSTNKDIVSGTPWAFNVDAYAVQAKAINAQSIITVNYGSGTPATAAAYVTYANKTHSYGFKYWEVGNECYGTWEYDINVSPNDPYTYGTRAAQYIQAMKAVDPSIKIGVVAVTGEDSDSNGYTGHPATNPRTNATHNGWVPVMLATMKAAGVLPDFLIYHRYDGSPGSESDSVLLQAALTWPTDAANLRQMVTDYLGTAGANVELLVTENNSVYGSPGKQSVSLVNGLYLADSIANVMQTEFNSLVWWDFHNGQSFNSATNVINIGSSLYGWRLYGDYGIENQPTGDRYPTFYVAKLLSHFARGGDTVVKTTSSANLVSAYGVKRLDGSLSVLVINKSPTATNTVNVTTKGFTPGGAATVYSYGIPQDTAAQNAAAASAPPTGGTVISTWDNTLDGWVNQSGPNDVADNYGLLDTTGPFLYADTFSTTTGVTNGTGSLVCTTTNANPGYSAILQNSTTAMGTALSTAQTISFDILPMETGSAVVNATLYFNGTGFTAYYAFPLKALMPNQENTVSVTLTDAERASIVASLGTGQFFQVGLIIQASNPLTAYLDNFTATYAASSAPSAPVSPTAAEDVAVTSLSGVGTSFSASVGPYSATVFSIQGPNSAPAATTQPASQTVASGRTVTFSFPATGGPSPTFQWFLNGSAISDATHSTLVVNDATAANAGSYTCVATNASGSVTSHAATLTVNTTTNPGRLVNLSARAKAGTGGNIIFGGFAIGGSGTSGSDRLLIRASGPALVPFGVGGTLPDPELQLFDSTGTAIPGDLNTGWAGDTQVSATAALVGAFAWTVPTSHDAALDLPLAAGSYTAQVSGQTGDTGVALMEVYDSTLPIAYTLTSPRLINLSARVSIASGASNALFAGFVIQGSTAVTVLIRASGPAIAAAPFNVPGTLPDPQVTLTNQADGSVLASNAGWGGDAVISTVASEVGAFSWGDPSSHDSALLVTLPPGNYAAVVDGTSGDAGVAIVEVYEVQ
jgi:Immunoglobulin domain